MNPPKETVIGHPVAAQAHAAGHVEEKHAGGQVSLEPGAVKSDKKGESRIRRWNVGNVKITSVMESADRIPWQAIFPAETSGLYKKYDWLVPRFMTPEGQIILAVQAFVLTVGGRRIVVDTCVGNDKPREIEQCNNLQTAFLKDLTAAGFPPETIDTVLCTHLHFDHVGWNTRLRDGSWVPTFPRARYLFGRRDLEFFSKQRHEATHREAFDDSVAPILDAGLADIIDSDAGVHREIGDGIWLEDVSGHSPGNLCLIAECGGERA